MASLSFCHHRILFDFFLCFIRSILFASCGCQFQTSISIICFTKRITTYTFILKTTEKARVNGVRFAGDTKFCDFCFGQSYQTVSLRPDLRHISPYSLPTSPLAAGTRRSSLVLESSTNPSLLTISLWMLKWNMKKVWLVTLKGHYVIRWKCTLENWITVNLTRWTSVFDAPHWWTSSNVFTSMSFIFSYCRLQSAT